MEFGTDKHTSGTKEYPATYTPCGGTFKDQHGKEYIKDINTYMIPKLQPVTDNPATGDQAPIALMVSLMAMCVLVLGVSYRKLLKTKL